MKRGTCKHYTGIMEKCCKLKVAYRVNWPTGPLPCIQFTERIRPGEPAAERRPWPGAAEAKPCPLREAPTDAEVQADREESERCFQRTIEAMKVASDWRIRPKPAVDRREVVECPICKGRLHLSQFSYNGHVHGKCETERCVSWME